MDKTETVYLTCIKTFDGMSLFSRNTRNSKALPLSLISTLNSLFTYGDNYGVKIHSADSKDFKIIWKTFHSSITLILIEPLLPVNEQFYFNKIDILFNALVLLYGLDDLVNIANTEKFKKEIKVTYNILDAILHNSGKFDLFGGYLTGCTDALVINDSNVLQASIDESCLAVNTSLGCVMVNGRVIVASRTWWDLNATEAYLISLLCLTLSDSTSRDIPIYLPYKSPNEALRLLTYNLTSNNVMLCFICEEKPTIDAVEPLIKTLWHPIYKSLINLKQYFPRNLPPNLNLDDNMIGFLLINKNSKCCYSSLCPNETRSIHIDEMNKRYDLLRFCYLNITTNYFTKYFKDSGNRADENDESTNCPEAYTLIRDHKFYALNDPNYQFFAIYNQAVPTYALRGVTKTCYNILIAAV